MMLNIVAVAAIPIITPAMIRHDAMRANTMIAAPTINARVETSPIEPGKLPKNASIQVIGSPVATCLSAASPPCAHCESAVAPEKPSAAVQTKSPEICAGYAKNKNARPANAGFIKFLPTPPKTSFATTKPKVIPRAACHNGNVGGTINANKMVVTKKPSFTS